MRILFVITGLAQGGGENQLVQLALQLRSHGHLIRLVSMIPATGFAAELSAANIPVESLGMERGVPNPMAVVRFSKVIRRFGPDIVHAHMVHANLLARFTRLVQPMPALVCTAQNVYEASTRTKTPSSYTIRDLLYGLTDPLAEITTQVCKAGAERYVRVHAVSARRMRLIYNAVDVAKFGREGDSHIIRDELNIKGRWVWLAVGRLEAQKDFRSLILAFKQVRDKIPQAFLVIAGEGYMRQELEDLISKLDLGQDVVLLGIRRDVAALMAGANAFVLSSIYEGLPLVLAEAAASRLPIVATNVGGNADVVLHGKTGFLVPKSRPNLLAEAMMNLMRFSGERLAEMGAIARAHAERHFDMSEVVKKWVKLYSEVTGRVFELSRAEANVQDFALKT